jgi:hypothetical protein
MRNYEFPPQRPKPSPEYERRMGRVKEWIAAGLQDVEVRARAMYEGQLELDRANAAAERGQQAASSGADASADEQDTDLRFIRSERLRVLAETSAVMHDPNVSNANRNFALRFMTAATRLLSDLEKSTRHQAAPVAAAAKPSTDSFPGGVTEEEFGLECERRDVLILVRSRDQGPQAFSSAVDAWCPDVEDAESDDADALSAEETAGWIDEKPRSTDDAAAAKAPPAKRYTVLSPYADLSQEKYEQGFQEFLAAAEVNLKELRTRPLRDPRLNAQPPIDLWDDDDSTPSAPSARSAPSTPGAPPARQEPQHP